MEATEVVEVEEEVTREDMEDNPTLASILPPQQVYQDQDRGVQVSQTILPNGRSTTGHWGCTRRRS